VAVYKDKLMIMKRKNKKVLWRPLMTKNWS
jgi:hypothetical protein